MLLKVTKILFNIYQGLFRSATPTCRYRPTCSKYALDAIEKYGAYGVWLATKRILSCHPFSKRPFIDPV